jgi:hypothetical protein
MSRYAKTVLRHKEETTMNQSEMVAPLQQQVFEFARTDVWDHLPATVREGCLGLITQQLKQAIESERKETEDE